MKKLLFAFVLVATTTVAFGQAKSNGIKTNPLGMAFGVINLSYESALNEGSSFQVSAAVISLDLLGTSLSGFGLGAEYRLYPGEALQGFYYGPLASYASITVEDSTSKGTVSAIGGGGQFGWNWLMGKEDNFIIDLGLGAVYNAGSVNVEEGTDSFDLGGYDGIAPVLTFAIGYAW